MLVMVACRKCQEKKSARRESDCSMRTDRYDKAKSPFRNLSANAAKNVTSEVLYVAMLILCNKESVRFF